MTDYSTLSRGRVVRRWLAGLLLAMSAGSGWAGSAETPARLDGSQAWSLADDQGRHYRLFVSEPEGEAPERGFPVLYVLDANAYFPAFHAAKRAQDQYAGSIIVGIGYPGSSPLDFRRRAWDFSPPPPGGESDPPQGGQDQFLDFIEGRLMPAVADAFPVDPHRQGLYGHSFGGMFALYTLFTRPGLFDHTVASSPSLWWRDRYLLEHEAGFVNQVKSGDIDATHLSLAVMAAQGDSPQDRQDAEALSERLRPLSAQGLRVSWQLVEGEDHMSIPFRTLNAVLDQVLRARR